MRTLLTVSIALLLTAASCTPEGPSGNETETTTTTHETPPAPRVKGPAFSADSAYATVKALVDFGPRVPGSPAHKAAYEYIQKRLEAYGLKPEKQEAPTLYHGYPITMKNIFAQYRPERKERVLLLTHWDTRPVADEDSKDPDKPFDGADDGGSGVGVMLEIARALQQQDPNIGVDLLFVDAEDGGSNGGPPEEWCLGSQFWAQSAAAKGYKARFGILLDMVGGRGAQFPREGTGVYFASTIVEKVWSAAAQLGYSNLFTNDITGETTDDHLFVNKYTGIPTIDIVHYNMQKMSYPDWHHKHSDSMDIIDPATLQAVGNVLTDVLYNEMPKPVK